MAQGAHPGDRPRPGTLRSRSTIRLNPTGDLIMLSQLSSSKVRSEHLDRQALIYVRQSTPMQVRDHTASAARQYDLAQYAEQLGWLKERIQVIDQDQGLSDLAPRSDSTPPEISSCFHNSVPPRSAPSISTAKP